MEVQETLSDVENIKKFSAVEKYRENFQACTNVLYVSEIHICHLNNYG